MDGSLSEDKKLKAMLVNAGVLIPLKKYDQMTMMMMITSDDNDASNDGDKCNHI